MISIITGRRAPQYVVACLALAGMALAAGCDKLPLLAPSLSTITLSSNSTVVQANGTAQISATVLEQAGTPVQNGTTVTFTTTLGALSPAEARTVNGVATTQFVANGQSGVAEIRAMSGGAKPADTDNASLKLNVGGAAAARVIVTANPTRLSAGGSSAITATISDTNGNPLSGVTVSFSVDVGSLSSSVATTNASGQATTTLTTSREAKVTATIASASTTAPTVTGDVTVHVGALPSLSLTVNTTAPTEDGAVNTTLTVTPTASSDPFQSLVVYFGDGESRNLGVFTPNGTTAVTIPLSHVYRSDGTFTMQVIGTGPSGDTTSAVAFITVAPHTPVSVTVTPTGTTYTTAAPVVFTATVPTGTSVAQYSWNFGDAGSPTNTSTTTGNVNSHHFTVAGTYVITVTVTTTDGNVGNGQIVIVVS